MNILKQQFKNNKKDGFIQRVRILLATKGLLLSDKTYEVLYWLLYYILEQDQKLDGKTFKNMNQMHVAIAKEIGVYSSYVGAYINDRLIKNNIITKQMSISSDKFSKAKIEKYEIPNWLITLYNSQDFKLEITLNYE
jgi:hypothetical protein